MQSKVIVSSDKCEVLCVCVQTGMPTGRKKKRGTTGRLTRDGELPLPLRSFKEPPILSEIISSDLDEYQESIFWCKKQCSAEDWHPWYKGNCYLQNLEDIACEYL